MEKTVKRIFLALDFAPAFKQEVYKKIEEFPLHYIRFVPPENLHLTLRWFGDMTDEGLQHTIEALAPLTKEHKFEATLEGLQYFQKRDRNSVLWIGFGEGKDRSVSLYQRVNELLGITEEKKERPFSPHITISRVRPHIFENKSFMRIINTNREFFFGKTTVAELVLFESVATSEGRKYVPIQRFPLK